MSTKDQTTYLQFKKIDHKILAPQFKTRHQQASAGRLGMWIFLAQEIILFSGFFCCYGYLRYLYPDILAQAQSYLNWKIGCINSVILLISSLTMSFCLRFIRMNDKITSIKFLVLTIICVILFLILKSYEWGSYFHLGLFPGRYFHPIKEIGMIASNIHTYFTLFFIIIAIFIFHVLSALGLMVYIFIRSSYGEFNSKNYIALENIALFWQYLNITWIFLYTLLYLAK